MKNLILAAILIFAAAIGAVASPVPARAQDKPAPAAAPAAEPVKLFTLDNGLRVVLYERRAVPLVNVVVAVNVGSKDESPAESGTVHALEHYILFRGTGARSGDQVGRDVRAHGAYFNAHTGHDMASFEISLPAEHADFALRNQKEILFDLQVEQAGLDAEKEVLSEEYRQLQDDPFRMGTDLAYRALFPGHPYGRPVYGDPEVVKGLTAEAVGAFHRRFFVPANAVVAVAGDFDLASMEAKVREVFGPIPKAEAPRREFPMAKAASNPAEVKREMDVQDGYVIMAYPAPDMNDAAQPAMDVMTEMLGRGINPLLYGALRGRRDLVQNVSMAYFGERYGGAVMIYLTLEPGNASSAARAAERFLREVRNGDFAPTDVMGDAQMYAFDHLGSAKNQILFNSETGMEVGLNLAGALARSVLLREMEGVRPYLERVKKVSSSDIRKLGATWFSGESPAVVIVTPKKKAKGGAADGPGGGR